MTAIINDNCHRRIAKIVDIGVRILTVHLRKKAVVQSRTLLYFYRQRTFFSISYHSIHFGLYRYRTLIDNTTLLLKAHLVLNNNIWTKIINYFCWICCIRTILWTANYEGSLHFETGISIITSSEFFSLSLLTRTKFKKNFIHIVCIDVWLQLLNIRIDFIISFYIWNVAVTMSNHNFGFN